MMNLPETTVTCETTRADIVALIDGELTSERAAAVEGHIAGCRECADLRAEIITVLQITNGIFVTSEASGIAPEMLGRIHTLPEPTEAELLLAELRSVRAEMQAMRSEMADLRRQVAGVRGQIADIPARTPARPISPYPAPMDRLRTDRYLRYDGHP